MTAPPPPIEGHPVEVAATIRKGFQHSEIAHAGRKHRRRPAPGVPPLPADPGTLDHRVDESGGAIRLAVSQQVERDRLGLQ